MVVTSLKANATVPAQLSLAVATAKFGVAVQLIVEAAGNTEIIGAILSLTFIVCDTDDALPQASVKVHVLVITNALAHEPATKLSVVTPVITSPQLSLAVSTIAGGTFAAQATVIEAGDWGAVGAILSFTFIVWNTEALFPHVSVNVHVLIITKEFGQDPNVVTSIP